MPSNVDLRHRIIWVYLPGIAGFFWALSSVIWGIADPDSNYATHFAIAVALLAVAICGVQVVARLSAQNLNNRS